MNYEKFKSIMIEDIPLDKLPEEQLLNKMKEKPERFLSDFQLQDDSSRFMKILVTSSTIRLGRAFEKIIKAYFEKNKYTNMEEEAKFKLNSKKHEIDILVSKNNDILVIEQKIRDDHDKGKKENILKDLKLKWNYIKNKNNTKNVKGILYFVDPILQVNKNHYEKKLQNIDKNLVVLYGEDLFKLIGIPEEWIKLKANFQKFKNEYNHKLFNSTIKLLNDNKFTVDQTLDYKKAFHRKGVKKLENMKKIIEKYGVEDE